MADVDSLQSAWFLVEGISNYHVNLSLGVIERYTTELSGRLCMVTATKRLSVSFPYSLPGSLEWIYSSPKECISPRRARRGSITNLKAF